MERLVILSGGPRIEAAEVERALPREEVPAGSDLRAHLEGAERERIAAQLAEAGWNVSAAAQQLGLDRASLHRKIRKYGLTRGGS